MNRRPLVLSSPRHAALDALKLSLVVGYDRQITREGLPRDQYVVGANRSADCRQLRAQFAGTAGILLIEPKNLELQALYPGQVVSHTPTFVSAVKQLLSGDGRYPELVRPALAKAREKVLLTFQ